MSGVETVTLWLFFISAPPAVLFPIVYKRMGSPMESPAGRAIFLRACAVAVIYVISISAFFLGRSNVIFDWLALFGYAFLAWSMWYLLVTFIRVVRSGRRLEEVDRPSESASALGDSAESAMVAREQAMDVRGVGQDARTITQDIRGATQDVRSKAQSERGSAQDARGEAQDRRDGTGSTSVQPDPEGDTARA